MFRSNDYYGIHICRTQKKILAFFNAEYKESAKNYYELTRDLDAKFPYEGGLDGPMEIERRKLFYAYQDKLDELKFKYGIKDLPPVKIQTN